MKMKYQSPSLVAFNNSDIAEFEALAGSSSSGPSSCTIHNVCGCNSLCICDAK